MCGQFVCACASAGALPLLCVLSVLLSTLVVRLYVFDLYSCVV